METKSLGIEIKDAEKGIVRAVFARTGEVDKHKDYTLPGAFGEQRVRVSAYGHTSTKSGALPVGRGVIREEDNLAVADLQFFLNTSAGREHFEVIKEMGDLQEWSYGFAVRQVGEVTDEIRQKGADRVLARLEVHEVSPVLVGAGFNTQTLAVKSDEGEPDPPADPAPDPATPAPEKQEAEIKEDAARVLGAAEMALTKIRLQGF